MAAQGWAVKRHYLLETAWEARFTRGNGGRVVGVNSEMDALPGIGHACGHNLIAIAGVAVACALRAVMEEMDVSGTVILLGTPGMRSGFRLCISIRIDHCGEFSGGRWVREGKTSRAGCI